ncbi:S9 family peptidase [Rhodohalobacter mucosus]|uniref:S9 family peptidase n=1 Tax=Rhodohalobacter mucosus TaxID=2079485 RepID=A0A316TXA3_9BACT|nr:S9 family peptidase [Rhodohalobacter mucosus]PWN07895.1 S9 family peptidase [Rhodohalobacter mucosus]
MNKGLLLTALFFIFTLSGCASTENVQTATPAAEPETERVSAADYERAEQMLSWNLSGKVHGQRVSPQWIDSDTFWYRVRTPEGALYKITDAASRTTVRAFDHERLAAAIQEYTGTEQSAVNLPLQNLSFSNDLDTIRFTHSGNIVACSIESYTCEEESAAPEEPSNSVLSPDGTKAVYIKDYNLWVKDLITGEETQLTTDGVQHYGYGINNQGWNRSDTPIVKWSPDSDKLATYRLDERGVEMMTLWRTQVGRPEADIWPYALPGDSIVPMLERVVLDVEEAGFTKLDTPPSHQRTSNCCGLVRNGEWGDNEWSGDGSKLAFVSTSRDYKEVTLYLADAFTGEVRQVYHERDDIFFESNLSSRGVPNWRVLHNSNEFIWFTRKDNWGHLYLHDLETGNLKNRITEGEWNVMDIVRVDEVNRQIWFTAVGVEGASDPYHEKLMRANFDGSGLIMLTQEDFHHDVDLSPDANYIVSTHSDFETPQVSVLRNEDGEILMTLEEADATELYATGWQAPQSFVTKGRDGETDIHGIMFLPSNFDPDKKYPIVNSIYPGPQTGSIGGRGFSTSRRGQAHALAELGFVVVQVDAMGTPFRSREFHTAYYGDMSDNGLPDQIAAMEQLAERHDFIDIERAGMYGHSGGGFATASALFQYPDFFKAGVSSAGNHDNRGYTYYWGEKYQGLLEETGDGEDSYTNQANHLKAENLEGKLLISYGTMDTNVHPSMTLLVVNELIRHNKNFELIVMPNRGHGFGNEPYHLRRTWDFFVRHLKGAEPPEGYRIMR